LFPPGRGELVNRDARWEPIHWAYLRAAYHLGEERDRNGVAPLEVQDELGLDEVQGDEVLELLVEAGMIVWPAKGELMLTELGLKKAEELVRAPKKC
jgi:Mn-dependent DtxR family transcriptional regulator